MTGSHASKWEEIMDLAVSLSTLQLFVYEYWIVVSIFALIGIVAILNRVAAAIGKWLKRPRAKTTSVNLNEVPEEMH